MVEVKSKVGCFEGDCPAKTFSGKTRLDAPEGSLISQHFKQMELIP